MVEGAAVGVIAEIAYQGLLLLFLETNKKKILSWLMLTLAIVSKKQFYW
jgi:hypothetical protein